jgi:hypothetical protein
VFHNITYGVAMILLSFFELGEGLAGQTIFETQSGILSKVAFKR